MGGVKLNIILLTISLFTSFIRSASPYGSFTDAKLAEDVTQHFLVGYLSGYFAERGETVLQVHLRFDDLQLKFAAKVQLFSDICKKNFILFGKKMPER